MRKTKLAGFALATLAFALLVATSGAASAKAKKVVANPTYEEAWGICAKELDHHHISRQNAGQRYAAGGACMHRYGYSI